MQVLAKTYSVLSLVHSGYIAGSGDGIVTVKGTPSARKIWLFNSNTMMVEQTVMSLRNGHYMIFGLNPNKLYVVMVRDFAPDGSRWTGEAVVWDYVKPATDIDLDAQQGLWNAWQTI